MTIGECFFDVLLQLLQSVENTLPLDLLVSPRFQVIPNSSKADRKVRMLVCNVRSSVQWNPQGLAGQTERINLSRQGI